MLFVMLLHILNMLNEKLLQLWMLFMHLNDKDVHYMDLVHK